MGGVAVWGLYRYGVYNAMFCEVGRGVGGAARVGKVGAPFAGGAVGAWGLDRMRPLCYSVDSLPARGAGREDRMSLEGIFEVWGLRRIMEGILEAEDALREAQEAESERTITAISYAYISADIDNITRMIVVRTGNRFFGGDRDEIRRGRVGNWTLIWHRCDVGVTTGEDFMPEDLRAWLLRHTRAEANAEESAGQDEYHDECYDDDPDYWDTYPW